MLLIRSWLDAHTGHWPGNHQQERSLHKAALKLGPPPIPNRAEFPYKGTLVYRGMLILVENPKGSTRKGTDADGNPWSVTMAAHYGEFADTLGMDGDPVDVFVGEHPESEMAYVVHQKHPGTQVPDEDKVVLCCRTAKEAEELYRANYERPGFFHGITPWPVEELAEVLRSGKAKGKRLDKPVAVRAKLGKGKGQQLAKPPDDTGAAWEPIPKGRKGGYRRRAQGGGWDYWYADQHTHDHTHHQPHQGKRTLGIDEERLREMSAYLVDELDEMFTKEGSGYRIAPEGMVRSPTRQWTVRRPNGEPVRLRLLVHSSKEAYSAGKRGGIGKGKATGQDFVVLYAPSDAWMDRKQIEEMLRETLAHEMTHAIDPQAAKQTEPARDMAPGEYVNKPTEFTAIRHEVFRDLNTPKAVEDVRKNTASPGTEAIGGTAAERKEMRQWMDEAHPDLAGIDVGAQRISGSAIFGILMRRSDRFRLVHAHLSPENKKRIFDMAYKLVHAHIEGTSKPMEKGTRFLMKADFGYALPGSVAKKKGLKPEDFDADDLAAGVKVELEHTTDHHVATEIAMAHLDEDRDYYRKLAKMEKGLRWLLKATIKTPKGADGKVDYDRVPTGASIWVSVSDPASPLHGRPILITKRPDGQFALTGGSAAKHIQARRHLTMQGAPIRTSEKDEEKLKQHKEAEERNAPRRQQVKHLQREARAKQRAAESEFMEALGIKKRGLGKEEREKIHAAAHEFAQEAGLQGQAANSFAKNMADGIARKEREVAKKKAARALEFNRAILSGADREQAEEMAGPAVEPLTITMPEVDPEEWNKLTPEEQENTIQRHLDQQEADATLQQAEDSRFDPEPPPAEEKPEEPLAEATPTDTTANGAPQDDDAPPPAEPLPDTGHHTDSDQEGKEPEAPEPERPSFTVGQEEPEPEQAKPDPFKDREKARAALEKYAEVMGRRKEVREIQKQMEKPPETEVATSSAVEELRLQVGALSDEELAEWMREYSAETRNPPDTAFYDAMSPHWNETNGNKLAGSVNAGAASALSAMVGEDVAARYDVRRLVDALGPEVGAMAVIGRMRQEMSKDEFRAWVDKTRDHNATNQRTTERKALDRHRELLRQADDLDRQIASGDIQSAATRDMLIARNLLEQRENLGTALGSLQSSAAAYHFGEMALGARWTAGHEITINAGNSKAALDDKLKRLGKFRGRIGYHPTQGYQVHTTLDAIRKFAARTEKNKADADHWRGVKYDTSNIERDSEGREWAKGYTVPRFRSHFQEAEHLPADLAHLAGKPIGLMADQRNNIEWIHGSGGGLVNMRTGGGKTLVSIGVAAKDLEKNHDGRHLRVVPDGRQDQWANEIRSFTDIPVVTLPQNSNKAEREHLIRSAPPGSVVIVGHTHAGRYDHETLANSHEWRTVGIDEPQELRSKTGSGKLSAGAKRIFKIQAANRHALTATPATEHAGEVYDIVNWARPKVLGFRSRFQGAFDGFGGGTNAQDEALQRMLYSELEPHVSGERMVAPHYGVDHQDHKVSMGKEQLVNQREIESRVDSTVQAAIEDAKAKKREGKRGYADKSYAAIYAKAKAKAMAKLEAEHQANLGAGDHGTNPKLGALRAELGKADPNHRHVIFVDSPEQRRAVTAMLEDMGHKGKVRNITASAKSATRKVGGETVSAIDERKREWKGEGGGFMLIDRTSASGHNLAEGDHLHVLGNPDDAAQMLQAHGRLGRANREGDFAIHTYKYNDSPFEHHRWNRLERQLKVLRATAPGLFVAGTGQAKPKAAGMAKGRAVRWLMRVLGGAR